MLTTRYIMKNSSSGHIDLLKHSQLFIVALVIALLGVFTQPGMAKAEITIIQSNGQADDVIAIYTEDGELQLVKGQQAAAKRAELKERIAKRQEQAKQQLLKKQQQIKQRRDNMQKLVQQKRNERAQRLARKNHLSAAGTSKSTSKDGANQQRNREEDSE